MASTSDLKGYPFRKSTPDNEQAQINNLIEEVIRVLSESTVEIEWGDIAGALGNQTDLVNALDEKSNAEDAYTSLPVSANISPDLGDIKHDSTYHNVSTPGTTRTITLPTTINDVDLGKRFHFVASATWSGALTVTCSSVGLIRDSSNSSAPFTVTNGRLTITCAEGASGAKYYSASGDYS